MNRPVAPPIQLPVTQAAEGLPRYAWTVARIEEATRLGLFLEDDRFELIGGEIVPLAPKSMDHEVLKAALNEAWCGRRQDNPRVIVETTLRLDERTFLEPDFCVFARSTRIAELCASNVLLVVELADDLPYDLGRKVAIYAAYGLREVWVIDARSLVTRVHRRLGASGYAEIGDFARTERIEPMLAPELGVRLANLGLKPTRKRG